MKKRIALLALVLTMGMTGMTALAAEAPETGAVLSETGEEIEPRIKDLIETYYRDINGHLYYRRWNATKGYWVDPYWIFIA